jgi:hypothetical protein
MAAVVQDSPREDQPFTMNPPTAHKYNVAQQTPIGAYPRGNGPYPSVRQRRSLGFNTEGSIPTTAYASPIYQSSQLVPTDHHPVLSSQQTPTQQPSPPQSFKDPSPTHINQPSGDKTPEFADPVPRFSNSETPAPLPQPYLYSPWESGNSYGQDPPPSQGPIRSVSQQQGFQSPRSFGGSPPQQPPDVPPVTTSSVDPRASPSCGPATTGARQRPSRCHPESHLPKTSHPQGRGVSRVHS